MNLKKPDQRGTEVNEGRRALLRVALATPFLALEACARRLPAPQAATKKVETVTDFKNVPIREMNAHFPHADSEVLKKRIRETLSGLPRWHLNHLKEIVIDHDTDMKKNKGEADKISFVLRPAVIGRESLEHTVLHEMGHHVDLGIFEGKPADKPSAFRHNYNGEVFRSSDPSLTFYTISWDDSEHQQLKSSPFDFVSDEAKKNPLQDFAETYAFYAENPSAMETMGTMNAVLLKKLNFMRDVVFASNAPQ